MNQADLVEKLADAEHASWARWMDYLFTRGHFHQDGSFTIDAASVEMWLRKAQTPYAALTEQEKRSDRDEVFRILPIIEEYTR